MNIDWDKLAFSYLPTRSHIRYTFRDGHWDGGELFEEHRITLPIAATCFHYGQTVFEGLKAFNCQDGRVRIFRPDESCRRLNRSMRRIMAPEIPYELFLEGVLKVVRDNIDYIPPYGTGGSLYIRPFAIGSGNKIGVSPSDEYVFIILVTPVGAYYKGGMKPVDALIIEEFDRAAPKGTGNIKLGGNYAASLKPSKSAKEKGFDITLFLDAQTRTYIDEFGTSNFIAITDKGEYITPDSDSILRSITNKSLIQLAEREGIPVIRRKIHVDELATLSEVGACGTAVVITPVRKIAYKEKVFYYGEECGPVLQRLYNLVTGIQVGEIPDEFDWLVDV